MTRKRAQPIARKIFPLANSSSPAPEPLAKMRICLPEAPLTHLVLSPWTPIPCKATEPFLSVIRAVSRRIPTRLTCGFSPESRHNSYKLPPEVLTRSPGHHQDWIRAAKGGERSCSDFSISGPLTEWVLLATIAMRVPGKLKWDAAKTEFTNNKEANQLVKPDFRKSWSQVWTGKKLNKV